MAEGWIKIHRKITGWEWYNHLPVFKLFIHLLLTANHEDKKWKGRKILKGQLLTSRNNLAKQTGLTVQQVRTALDKLSATSEITVKTTKGKNYGSHLISIINWDKYQLSNQDTNQVSNPTGNHLSTFKQPFNNHLSTTTKELKNEENGKNEEKAEAHRAKIFTDKAYYEQIRMNWRVTDDQLKKMLDDFEMVLVAGTKNHKDYGEYKKHFHNWAVSRFTEYVSATKTVMTY